MLNNPPGNEAAALSDTALQQQRRTRRRPLSSDRIHGWHDVRKLDDDDSSVAKYHVDLNLTAHLNWDEWQRLCTAEPAHQDPAAWCVLSAIDAIDEEDEEQDDPQRVDSSSDYNDQRPRMLEVQGLVVHNQRAAHEQPESQMRFMRRLSPASPGRSAAGPRTGALA